MTADLCPEAYAAALAGLVHLTPRRLLALLERLPPAEAWASVRRGVSVSPRRVDTKLEVVEVLQRQAHAIEPETVWNRCLELGVAVSIRGHAGYPDELVDDLFAPAVLFSKGSLSLLERRRVGIVGTRNATALGRTLAFEFGHDLSDAGVSVISGLALGIDGAAHRGALASASAAPVGVVGSGLDVVYPAAHRALWDEVSERGVLMSEVPPGTEPAAYRFPARNRIIAALCEVLVVVESRKSGGSLLTAQEALDRGRSVLAMPGSPRNPASVGTNLLLTDGAAPATTTADILGALGMGEVPFGLRLDPRQRPSAPDRPVVEILRGGAATLDDLVEQLGRTLGEVALSLGRLEMSGWVVRSAGWFELVHPSEHRGGLR